jgi:putative flippase GtrA
MTPTPPPSERRERRDALLTFGPAVLVAFVLDWALTTLRGWPDGRALAASAAVGIVVALLVQRSLAR